MPANENQIEAALQRLNNEFDVLRSQGIKKSRRLVEAFEGHRDHVKELRKEQLQTQEKVARFDDSLERLWNKFSDLSKQVEEDKQELLQKIDVVLKVAKQSVPAQKVQRGHVG